MEKLIWEKTPFTIYQGVLNTQDLLSSPVIHMYVCMYVKMEFALKGRYFGSFCNFSEFRILEKVHIGNTDSFHCNWSALQDYQKL